MDPLNGEQPPATNAGEENEGTATSQSALRAQVRLLMVDTSLSPRERNQRIQNLMRSPDEVAPLESAPGDRSAVAPARAPFVKTFRDEQSGTLGCEHYARQVGIIAPCCGEAFTCRLCHDEASDHNLDRHAIETMICMHCLQESPVGEVCTNEACPNGGQTLAHYYCHVCRFFDDDNDKDIYHCEHCGICRRGQGLGIDYKHCHSCNACISMTMIDTHKCIERSLESDCPICSEFMFTSVDPVIFMRCGHAMHLDCYHRYIVNEYTCPICMRSVIDVADHFERIETYVQSLEIPPEYAGMTAHILCNDCLDHSETPFHFYYHKCGSCRSFNTRVVSKRLPNGNTTTDSDVDVVELGNAVLPRPILQEESRSVFVEDNDDDVDLPAALVVSSPVSPSIVSVESVSPGSAAQS